jgi:tetratricopeptide (TPR) repeat protein
MKAIYRIFLLFIFSSRLCALDMICPYGCDKDPYLYWDKQIVLRDFLYEGYPAGKCQLHFLSSYDGSYCSGLYIEDWYTIEWSSFPKWKYLQDPEDFFNYLYINRHVKFKPIWSHDEIPDREEKYFKLTNFAGFLAALSQLQSDGDHYIQHEMSCFDKAIRWYESALKHFQGLHEQGKNNCCSDGLGWAENLEQKIMETQGAFLKYQKRKEEFQVQANHLQNKLNEARNTILQLHEEQYQNCLENHKWSGAYYGRGLLNFSRGQVTDALDDIRKFMDGLKEAEKKLLSSEIYLNEGIVQSEVNLYNDAIVSLSRAIELDPQNKDAYFERAAAYFETGEFDLALTDYLSSGMRPFLDEPGVSFSKAYASGLVEGIKKGIAEEFGDGLPVWSPMLGVGLWALTSSPTPHAKLISGVLTCVAAAAAYVAADQISSELKDLITNWDHLTQKERGEISGYLIGKYGIDIFFMAGSAKMMKAYQDLKRANNVLTFEMMLLEENQVASLKNRYKAIEKNKKDKEYIQKYFGKNSYPEQEIRDNLQKMGYQIPEKPVGIPDNFITKYAEGVGICYHDPLNPKHHYIRLMPGNPHSSNPAQKQPYIIHMRNGRALDSIGNLLDSAHIEAHISPQKYEYIPLKKNKK